MDEHIYRLKQPEAPIPEELKPVRTPVKEVTEVKDKIEEHEAVDRPHSAKYFNVPDWAELLLNPKIDVNSIKDKIVFIESYIGDRVQKLGMKQFSGSFNKILSEIESYLNIDSKLYEPSYRINKVYAMLKTIEQTNKISEERKNYLESILSKL